MGGSREALLQIAAWGPAAGAAASLAMLLAGFALSAAGVPGGAELQPGAFQDSLLVGILGACFLPSPFATARSWHQACRQITCRAE